MTESARLEARLCRLERVNRYLVGAAVALAAVIGLAAAGSQSGASSRTVMSAGAFQLLDDEGAVVAELKVGENGPGLFILDSRGRTRVVLTHEAEQSGLFVLDGAGHSRIGVAQFAHGGGGVALHGPDAKGAAVLYFKGRGSLSFYDPEGNVTYRAPTPGSE